MATYTDPTTNIIPSGSTRKIGSGAVLAAVAAIIAVIVAVVFEGAALAAASQTTSTQNQADSIQGQVKTLQPVADKIAQLSTEAKNLHEIFDNQVRWETVITTLEGHLYRNMALTSFQFSDSGTFTFKGYTPTYLDYAKIYRSMTDDEGQKYFSAVKPTAVDKVKNSDGSEDIQFAFTANLTPLIMPVTVASDTTTND